MKASEESLMKAFKTTDVFKIAEIILKHGELQLTTEQRRKLTEEKRKQIINFISRHCVDPRTGLPHPPLRVEQALSQIHVVVDPFKDAEEQAKSVIESLRGILPIKFEHIKIAVKIPPEYAAKAIGAVKDFGTIERQEWGSDGSWLALVTMPAGLHGAFLDKLNSITHGNLQTKILK
jgi:ribosome maturation protein SDO1